MSRGSWLAPLIFVVCLILLPGAGGFFLALLVLAVIGIAHAVYSAREESSPMPDLRTLKLPGPRLFSAENSEPNATSQSFPFGEEVFKRNTSARTDPSRYLRTTEEARSDPVVQERNLLFHTPDNTKERGSHVRMQTSQRTTDAVLGALGVYFLYALAFLFLFAIAKSETLFFVFCFLFWGSIFVGIAALLLALLGAWPGLSIGAACVAIFLTARLFVVDRPDALLVLESSLTWLAACALVRLLLKRTGRESSLLFLVAKNGTEFLLVFAAANLTALWLPSLFRFIPLSRVLQWRDRLESAKVVLEKLHIAWYVTFAVAVCLFFGQRRFPSSKIVVRAEYLWKKWKRGNTWLKRIAFALTALFCFSYTATLRGNVIDSLQAEIKEFDKTYDKLVWDVYLKLSKGVNVQVYANAWDQLPANMKALVQKEGEINQLAKNIPNMYFSPTAPGRLSTTDFFRDPENNLYEEQNSASARLIESLPKDLSVPPESFENDRASAEATSENIKQADLEIKQLDKKLKGPEWMQGLGGDATDKFLGFVLDVNHVEFIKELKEHYPITGELLQIVSKSVQETLTDKLKETAERITRKRMQEPHVDVSVLILEEASSLARIDLPDVVVQLNNQDVALTRREAEVRLASERFKADLRAEMRAAEADTRSARADLETVRREVGEGNKTSSERDIDLPVNLSSLSSIRNKKRAYDYRISEIIIRSPSKQSEFLRILGQKRYIEIENVHSQMEIGPQVPTLPDGKVPTYGGLKPTGDTRGEPPSAEHPIEPPSHPVEGPL